MKALSLWQPWASYVALKFKRYETRSWSTPHRGLIAIHAAKRWTEEEKAMSALLHRRFPQLPNEDNLPLGAILCIARLTALYSTQAVRDKIDTMERDLGDYADGRFAWKLEIVELFDEPILAQGKQGLWDWEFPEEIAKKRIAIAGSRHYDDLDAVKRYVNSLPLDTTVISGGADGVDSTAEKAARERGLNVISIPVNISDLPDNYEERRRIFGQRAMRRNGDIVALAGSVTAFWDSSSSGTKNTIDRAKAAGKSVLINPTELDEQQPIQLKLAGFFNTYDEGAYIIALEKAKKIDAGNNETSDFVWEKPWRINDTHVWVKNLCRDGMDEGDQGVYKAVPIDSDEARSMVRSLSGFFYGSETLHLREWLDEQIGWQPIPFEVVDIGELDAIQYSLRPGMVEENVPVEHIIFTQDTYKLSIVREYMRSLKAYDENGNLPFGVRFSDSPRVYLLDGTHRVIAQRWQGRGLICMDVNTFPETLAQACGLVEDEDDSETIEFYADVLEQALAIIKGVELSDERINA